MKYQEILHRCFRCGYCKLPSSYQDINCPAYLKYRFESFAPGGRMWLLRAWKNGELKPGTRFQEIMFSCAACGNCVEHCVFPKFKGDLLNAFTEGRKELVEEGALPDSVAAMFKSLQLYGNPYKIPENERGKWANGLDLPAFDGHDHLFYVGCAGSFDEPGKRMARAVAKMLSRLGVNFGVLGEEESCDGNEARAMGELALFEHLASRNIEKFRDKEVKSIIALSPHAAHAFKTYYPSLGAGFTVVHYTQVMAARVKDAAFDRNAPARKVTFHDPCYLGRHGKDYFSARAALALAPGIELVEMERNKADALCCGGGGGNFVTDILGGGKDAAARCRAREAADTGAEVLAVACPKCMRMLEDAVEVEGLGLRVMDPAMLWLERME